MARSQDEKSVADFNAVRLTIASREDILAWSYGEVLKPETIKLPYSEAGARWLILRANLWTGQGYQL